MKTISLRKAFIFGLLCSVAISYPAISYAKKGGDKRVIEQAIEENVKATAMTEEDPADAIEEVAAESELSENEMVLEQEVTEAAAVPPEGMEMAKEAEAEEVVEAEEPEAAPRQHGIAMGNYVVSPRISLQTTHTDNALFTETNEDDDVITTIKPGIMITTKEDYEHRLTLDSAFEYNRYSENDDESHNNFHVSLDGQIAKDEAFSLPFELSYAQDHEDRMDDITGQRPVERLEMSKFYSSVGFRFKDGPLTADIAGYFGQNRYDDELDINGNQVVRRDADHDIVGTKAALTWDMSDHVKLGLMGKWGDRDYDQNNFQGGGFNGPNRSSDITDARLVFGLNFKSFKTLIKAGWGMVDFEEDAVLSDINTAVADIGMTWNITNWLDWNLNYSRDIHEDEEVIQAILRDKGNMSFAFKLGEHVRWEIGGEVQKWSFEESTRDDRYAGAHTSLDYFFNDFVALGASYKMLKRDSDLANLDFDNNTIMLHLSGRM